MHIIVQQFDINKRITNQNKRNEMNESEAVMAGATGEN